MTRLGDPCTSCGRKEPDAKFSLVRGKNQGTRRERPVWHDPGNVTPAGAGLENIRETALVRGPRSGSER